MLCYSCERGYFLVFLPVPSVVVANVAIRDPLMVDEEVMSLIELTLGVIVSAVALEEVV